MNTLNHQLLTCDYIICHCPSRKYFETFERFLTNLSTYMQNFRWNIDSNNFPKFDENYQKTIDVLQIFGAPENRERVILRAPILKIGYF